MNWQNWYTDFSKLLCGFVKVVHILRLLPAKIKPKFRWKRNKCEARQFLVGTTKPILLFTRLLPSAEVKRPQRQPFRLLQLQIPTFFQFKSSIYINVLLAEIVAAWKSVSIAMHDIKRYKKSMLFEKLKYTTGLRYMEKQATKITQLVEDFLKSTFAGFVVLWRQCFLYCRNKTFLCEALTQPNRWTRTWPRILMVVFLFLLTTSKCLWN